MESAKQREVIHTIFCAVTFIALYSTMLIEQERDRNNFINLCTEQGTEALVCNRSWLAAQKH